MTTYQEAIQEYKSAVNEWESQLGVMESWMDEYRDGHYDADTVQTEAEAHAPALGDCYEDAEEQRETLQYLRSGLELVREDDNINIPALPKSTGLQERLYSRINNLDHQYTVLEQRQNSLVHYAEEHLDVSLQQHLDSTEGQSYLERFHSMDAVDQVGVVALAGIGSTLLYDYLQNDS